MNMPLTRSQQLIWLGQQKHADNALYNMALAIHIKGALDTEQLLGLYLDEVYNHFSPAGNEFIAGKVDAWVARSVASYPEPKDAANGD